MALSKMNTIQLVRDGVVASTGTIFSTSSAFAAEYPVNDRLMFMVCWKMSSDSSDPRYARLTINAGDYWKTGQGSVSHLISASCSGPMHWFFGPYDQARFGIPATSSAFGVTALENYLDVLVMASCSSKCNSTGVAYASGEMLSLHAFLLPVATFTS